MHKIYPSIHNDVNKWIVLEYFVFYHNQNTQVLCDVINSIPGLKSEMSIPPDCISKEILHIAENTFQVGHGRVKRYEFNQNTENIKLRDPLEIDLLLTSVMICIIIPHT